MGSDLQIEVFVRKLALVAGDAGMTVILVTDASVARAAPLPVALRLELSRGEDAVTVAIGKERHGRFGLAKGVPLTSGPKLELTG